MRMEGVIPVLVVPVLLLLFGGGLFRRASAHESALTLSGCLRGSGCSQCPKTQYTTDASGEILCCPGCSSAVLYHGNNPNNWCVCYVDTKTDAAESKTLKFPGDTTNRFPSSAITGVSDSSSNFFYGSDHRPEQDGASAGKPRDALYILNQGDTRKPEVSQDVHQAITLMSNYIENINARLTRLEEYIILHIGNQGQITDRVGSAAATPSSPNSGSAPPSPTGGSSCPVKNFTRIGNNCYHISAWKDHRLIWEKASKTCEEMGARLAEPINTADFNDLTQYLSLDASTTGYSYWIGGIYLDIPWLWSYAGTRVTLNTAYWTGVDAVGKPVSPDDPTPGRCLSFSYLSNPKNYYFAADQCGFEKYYVCELIEKSHRRL